MNYFNEICKLLETMDDIVLVEYLGGQLNVDRMMKKYGIKRQSTLFRHYRSGKKHLPCLYCKSCFNVHEIIKNQTGCNHCKLLSLQYAIEQSKVLKF